MLQRSRTIRTSSSLSMRPTISSMDGVKAVSRSERAQQRSDALPPATGVEPSVYEIAGGRTFAMSRRSVGVLLDQMPDAFRSGGKRYIVDPPIGERIDDGVDDCGRRADVAGFASAFHSQQIGFRRHERVFR